MVGKMPKGYKKTEVGVIPEDWKYSKLGDVTQKIGSGITPTGGSKVYKLSGRPFVRSQNVLWGKLDLSEIVYIDDDTHATFTGTEINRDDVLLNITGASIGRAAIANDEVLGGNVNQHVCIIRPIQEELASVFLCTYLISSAGQRYIDSFQSGGNRQGLNFKQIASIKLPLPSLPEQTAIAQALTDMDNLIVSIEKLIAKKQSIKQGVMQELLTGKKRLDGFNSEWDYIELGSCADISKLAGFEYSKYFNSYNDGGEIIVIRGTNITKNKLDLTDVKTIPASTSNFLKRSQLKKDDLVFAYVGTIGPVYLITENNKFHLGPNTARITVNERVFPPYAFIYFTSDLIKKEIDEHISVGAQPSLSMTKIRKFKITIPSYAEQVAIAQILSDMDGEIEKLTSKFNKYKVIKQGMMQELLTGKRRLV